MKPDLDMTLALLERGPAAFDALLHTLPEPLTTCTEGEDSWSPRYVVAHLLYCERVDWMRRVRSILEHGELKTFEPLDREGGREQLKAMEVAELLNEFAAVRQGNLKELRALHLQPTDLERTGKHPAFGIVTLGQLLATWATHDLTHLHQVSRVLARQYDKEVGPWKRYLGVLHCEGHSERD